MIEIALAKVTDFDTVGKAWRELESRAEASFFQSWAWTGCLAAERFPDPVLVTGQEGGRLVALGLFNHRRQHLRQSSLWLSESGDPRHDDIFIEHNGLLIERGQPRTVLTACIEAARKDPIRSLPTTRQRQIRLSGVSDEYLSAARDCAMRLYASRPAPFVDLEALRCLGRDFLATTSGNTRYQIRRSERRYAALGPLAIQRARSLDEAQDFLAGLAKLHQSYWTGRGKPGAFANPNFERFHRALIVRAFADGGIDLLKVTAGATILGYLYNLSFQGHVCAYQTGFDYRLSSPQQKPGLTCHHLAIEMYLAEDTRRYDFLGGAERYKMSLANAAVTLHWIKIGGSGASGAFIDGIRKTIKRVRRLYTNRTGSTAAEPA